MAPRFFKLHELLPKDFYQAKRPVYGERLWMVFDGRILAAADTLRAMFGRMVANTWYWGGTNEYRGFRPASCTVGAALSQHRFGRALDLVPVETPVEEIRAYLRRHKILGITRVEDDVPWLHIDCADVSDDRVVFFKP